MRANLPDQVPDRVECRHFPPVSLDTRQTLNDHFYQRADGIFCSSRSHHVVAGPKCGLSCPGVKT